MLTEILVGVLIIVVLFQMIIISSISESDARIQNEN